MELRFAKSGRSVKRATEPEQRGGGIARRDWSAVAALKAWRFEQFPVIKARLRRPLAADLQAAATAEEDNNIDAVIRKATAFGAWPRQSVIKDQRRSPPRRHSDGA